jgi:Trypsin-co-occurring domain 1
MGSRVVEVVLPNKAVALVRAVELDEGQAVGLAEKVGWKESFDLEYVSETLEGVAEAIRSGLEKVKPTRTTVEFGIEMAVKNGKLTGILVEGEANASLKVTLEWGSEQQGSGSAPS